MRLCKQTQDKYNSSPLGFSNYLILLGINPWCAHRFYNELGTVITGAGHMWWRLRAGSKGLLKGFLKGFML